MEEEAALEEDWPEPSEEMTAAYLREMAAAYAVEIPRGVKKAEMVRLIQAARAELKNQP